MEKKRNESYIFWLFDVLTKKEFYKEADGPHRSLEKTFQINKHI